MAELYNLQTGTLEQIPDEESNDLFLSGKYGLKKDSTVNVYDPETENTYKIPATRAKDYLQSGFKFETQDQQLERSIRNDPDNQGVKGALKAFGGQAVNQALLGVPKAIYENVGDEDEDKRRRIETEALAENNPVSNIAGGVLGFTGSLFYGGPLWKGAAVAGNLAERGVAKALQVGGEKLAEKTVGKIATQAAKLAAENVAINAPMRLTEYSLGDPETAAETLSAGLMEDIGLGAGFGAGTSLVGPVLNSAGKKLLGSITPEALEQKAMEFKLKHFDWLTPEQNKLQQAFGTNNQKDAVKMASEFIDEMVPSKWDQLGGSDKLLEKVYEKRNKVADTMNAIRERGDELKPNGAVSYRSVVGNIDEMLSKMEELPTQNAASIADLNKAKQIVTENAEQKINGFLKETNAAERGVANIGDDAARFNVEDVNFTFKEAQDLKKLMGDQFWTNSGANPFKSVSSEGGHAAYSIMRDSIDNAMYQIAEGEGGEALAQGLKQANADWAQIKRTLKPIIEKSAIRDAARSTISLTDIGAAAAGAAAGGGAGLLRGIATNMFRKTYGDFAASEGLQFAAKTLQKVTNNIDGSINDFLSNSLGRYGNRAKVGSVGALSRFLGDDEEDKKLPDAQKLEKIRAQLTAVKGDPNSLGETANSLVGDLGEVAPNMYPLIHQNLNTALEYLTAQMPKPSALPSPTNPVQWIPSDREISSYSRKLDAVMNPYGILKEIKTGTLNRDSVDAVRTVYPKLFQAIQDRVLTRLNTLQPGEKYKVRSRLSLLLSTGMGQSVTPQKVGTLQNSFQQKNEARPQANSKITAASQAGTDIDRIIYD